MSKDVTSPPTSPSPMPEQNSWKPVILSAVLATVSFGLLFALDKYSQLFGPFPSALKASQGALGAAMIGSVGIILRTIFRVAPKESSPPEDVPARVEPRTPEPAPGSPDYLEAARYWKNAYDRLRTTAKETVGKQNQRIIEYHRE